ncbi:NADH-flavin reductase [Microbacterium sp. HM58-2]|nr:NADH-flavin reductase [Microbacterium sp. HM58-2]
MRITVLGGTGYAGGAVVAEAARRGHEVRSVSRSAPAAVADGVEYVHGSVLEEEFLASVLDGADAVFETLSPRGDLEGRLEGVFRSLMGLADRGGIRLGVMGGASSMLVSEGGPRTYDLNPPLPEHKPEADLGIWKLEVLQASPASLDWFYLSPGANFGAWFPQQSTGGYRLGRDVLLYDESGESHITASDLALAVVDEFETPAHRRMRFHAAV